ncbi:hypothetical protein CUN35_14615, partial [Enterococcus faecium]
LERIKKQYEFDDIYEIPQFETAKADEFIEKQRKEQGQNSFNNWKKQYNSQFLAIQEYIDMADENYNKEIDEFLESVKKFAKDTNESKSKSKYQLIKESNFEGISTKNVEKYLTELDNLVRSSDLWSLLKEPEKKKKIFIETYNELRIVYINKQRNNIIQQEVNKILDSVKKIVQSKTGITPVSDCEFLKIIKKEQTEKTINEFMKRIIRERELKKENIHGYQIIVKLTP